MLACRSHSSTPPGDHRNFLSYPTLGQVRQLCWERSWLRHRAPLRQLLLPGGQETDGRSASPTESSSLWLSSVLCVHHHWCFCAARWCWSDGGADRGHSLGLHWHAAEGEWLDGRANQEESRRKGRNLHVFSPALCSPPCGGFLSFRLWTSSCWDGNTLRNPADHEPLFQKLSGNLLTQISENMNRFHLLMSPWSKKGDQYQHCIPLLYYGM